MMHLLEHEFRVSAKSPLHRTTEEFIAQAYVDGAMTAEGWDWKREHPLKTRQERQKRQRAEMKARFGVKPYQAAATPQDLVVMYKAIAGIAMADCHERSEGRGEEEFYSIQTALKKTLRMSKDELQNDQYIRIRNFLRTRAKQEYDTYRNDIITDPVSDYIRSVAMNPYKPEEEIVLERLYAEAHTARANGTPFRVGLLLLGLLGAAIVRGHDFWVTTPGGIRRRARGTKSE